MNEAFLYLTIGFLLAFAFSDRDNSMSPILWIFIWPLMLIMKIIERIV